MNIVTFTVTNSMMFYYKNALENDFYYRNASENDLIMEMHFSHRNLLPEHFFYKIFFSIVLL